MAVATRHNVRQRRRDRIQQLLESEPTARSGFERTIPQAVQDASPMLNDPEHVWKEQQKRLDEYYRAQHEAEENWGRFWSPTVWLYKWIIAAILFAVCWAMFQSDQPWAKQPQHFITKTLQEDFDFEQLEQWYLARFDGYPSLIPAFRRDREEQPVEHANSHTTSSFVRPVEGSVVTPYTEQHPGIVIAAEMGQQVANFDVGRVVYVGKTNQTGLTVIIQHPNQRRTVYGFLGETRLVANDWVKRGEFIGSVGEDPRNADMGRLYFSIKESDQFINPLEVMSF